MPHDNRYSFLSLGSGANRRPSAGEIMNRHEHDSKALEVARQIICLVNGPMPIGGSVQLQAMIQVMIIDAMEYASGQPAIGGK